MKFKRIIALLLLTVSVIVSNIGGASAVVIYKYFCDPWDISNCFRTPDFFGIQYCILFYTTNGNLDEVKNILRERFTKIHGMSAFTREEFDRSDRNFRFDFDFDKLDTFINGVKQSKIDLQIFDYENYGEGVKPDKWNLIEVVSHKFSILIWNEKRDDNQRIACVPTRDYFKSDESWRRFLNVLHGLNPYQMFKPSPGNDIPGQLGSAPYDVEDQHALLNTSLGSSGVLISSWYQWPKPPETYRDESDLFKALGVDTIKVIRGALSSPSYQLHLIVGREKGELIIAKTLPAIPASDRLGTVLSMQGPFEILEVTPAYVGRTLYKLESFPKEKLPLIECAIRDGVLSHARLIKKVL